LQDQPEQRRYGFRVPFGAGGRASFRGTCVGMMMGFKAGWLGGIGLQAAGGRGGGGCRGGRTCAMARGNAYNCGGAACVVFLRIGQSVAMLRLCCAMVLSEMWRCCATIYSSCAPPTAAPLHPTLTPHRTPLHTSHITHHTPHNPPPLLLPPLLSMLLFRPLTRLFFKK
jgi:hypothetical protein